MLDDDGNILMTTLENLKDWIEDILHLYER